MEEDKVKRKLNRIRLFIVRTITVLVILMEMLFAVCFEGLTESGIFLMFIGMIWIALIVWANPKLRNVGDLEIGRRR